MKKTVLTIVIALVVIVLTVAAYSYYKEKIKLVHPQNNQHSVNSPKPKYASSGTLTPNLPTQLVLGNSPAIISSYEIDYAKSTQSTAVYQSKLSTDTVYKQYLSFFKNNKYEILNQNESVKISTIYAINASSDINVVIIPASVKNESNITISYLNK